MRAGGGLNCNLRGGLRAQISRPRRVLVVTSWHEKQVSIRSEPQPQFCNVLFFLQLAPVYPMFLRLDNASYSVSAPL